MKKYYIFGLVVLFALAACNKNELNQPTMQKAPAVDLGSLNNGERIFTDEQIEQIGVIHNEAVIKMVNDFNYNAKDIYAAFVEQLSQYDIYPMELAELPLEVSTEKYYSDVLQANLSEQAHKFIYNVAEICVEFGSVNEVANYIEKQKMFANKHFKGLELDGVLVALTVFKHSSQLWFDTEEGGMGLGVIFADNFEKMGVVLAPAKKPMKASIKEKIIECLKADGVGAAQAAIAAGVIALCAPTPITVASALYGIGISAGISSIWKLVEILLDGTVLPQISPDKPDVVIKWKDYIMVDKKLVPFPILVNPYFPIK